MDRAEPQMTKHVRDLWAEDDEGDARLFEAAEAVERCLGSAGWQEVHRLLSREVALIDRELEGPTKSESEYAKRLGERRSMRAAHEAAKAIVEKAEQRRGRAEQRAQVEDLAARAESERIGV